MSHFETAKALTQNRERNLTEFQWDFLYTYFTTKSPVYQAFLVTIKTVF